MSPTSHSLDTASTLRVLLLGVTGHCNLRCKMCSIWHDPNSCLSDKHLQSLLNDDLVVNSVEYLGITGGEPFLNGNLVTIVKECAYGFNNLRELSVTTNGSLPKRIDTFGRGMAEACRHAGVALVFNLSLDGMEAVHDQQRGVNGLFHSVVSSLKLVRDLACKAENVSIQLSAVLTRWNVDSLVDLLSFAKKEHVRIVLSLPMDTSAYYRTDRLENDYSLLPEQKQQLVRELRRLLFASRAMQSLDSLTERHLIHLIENLSGKTRNEPCVFRSRTGCLVTSTGEVFACGGGEEFRLGHLDTKPLSAILGHPKSRNSPLQSTICDRCPSICYLQAEE